MKYNDIFYKQDAEIAKIRSGKRSHLQKKIIRGYNDMVPLIVGVMRRLMSDNNNEYSTFIL